MAEASVSAKTIIIADDTAFVRDRFCTALEERRPPRGGGEERRGAARAGPRLTWRQIDLIVLDLRLPPAPGVDLVRSHPGSDDGRLPILIFSGTIANADEVRDLAALGVAGYVNEYSAVQHILPSLAPHLFPDSFSRRGSPRVVLGIPVQYRFGNTLAAALMLNLSHGGIAIRTTSPLDNGSSIKVRFRLPGSKRDIDAEGRVRGATDASAWASGSRRSRPSQALINTFVDAHFFSNREALARPGSTDRRPAGRGPDDGSTMVSSTITAVPAIRAS